MSDSSSTMVPAASEFVVVANRLPVDVEVQPSGQATWSHSPGGLVAALEPILRARSGAWVGWAGAADVDLAPRTEDGLRLHPVRLSADEVAQYYEGFANATLWPLYHDVIVKPEFERSWWRVYREVNQRFAAAAAHVAAAGAIVWVQDYQLQLVPAMLRALRPDLTIGFFLHIPFPPVEMFMQLPWRCEIAEGLLGADLIGFQLPGGAENFLDVARRLLSVDTTSADGSVLGLGSVDTGGRRTHVGAFPISSDSARLVELSESQAVQDRAIAIRRELGHPSTIILGVDRLDYTKGIDVRLDALRELFDEGRLSPASNVLIQLATPSRERVEQYAQMRSAIDEQVGHINGDHSQIGRPAIHYLYQPVGKAELAALFLAADVMLVTPMRDGMNLVAKEYVAARADLGGALVLSEFAGAATELNQAYLVNPHDLDGVKNAIERAIADDPADKRERMRTMHEHVMRYDVHHWARAFLAALVELKDAPAASPGAGDGGVAMPTENV